jgi:multiple sugar transport system substrate-binding protein
MKGRRWIALLLSLLLAFSLAACSSETSSNSDSDKEGSKGTKEAITLKFMFWGSAFEKQAVDKMVKSFEDSHPGIKVDAQHVTGDYETKINTLMATGELPDVAYLGEGLALKWAEEGKVLDMTPYLETNPELGKRLSQTYYYFAPGKTIGTNTAGEIISLFYNKDLFKESKIDPPPANASEAWTWDEFVQVAKQLTIDKNGNNALQPGFDEKNIVQFGVSFPTWWGGWYPFLKSNGADIANEDGTKFTMNSPEAVEVFQKIQDLMYKHYVAPNVTQQQNMPATSVQLQTKKVAMAINGHWNILDFAESKLNYGVAVLPKFKEAKTIMLGAPTVIFSSTKHPKEAMEFYLFHNDPEEVDLFAKGLWMPLEMKYYTDQEYIDKWTKNDAHPPEFKQAVIDYTVNNAVPGPSYGLKNWAAIDPKIGAALDLIWTNKKSAKEALDEMEKTVQPLLKGKYPNK